MDANVFIPVAQCAAVSGILTEESVWMCIHQSVVVKGLERNISNIYEARRALLGLDSSEHAKINGVSHDPVLPGGGVTNYWLNMLLQQLRLSEQGELLAIIVLHIHYRTKKVPAFSQNNPRGIKERADSILMGLFHR